MEQNRNCGNNGFEMYNIGDRCEYINIMEVRNNTMTSSNI